MFNFSQLVALSVSAFQDKAWGPEPPVAPFTSDFLPDEQVVLPIIFPLIGKCRWFNDYNVNRGNFRHTGIDIRAPKMTPIVAPFGGIIGLKAHSFWIYGDNGWAMLGTHLNDDTPGTNDGADARDFMFAPDLTPNGRVEAGQFIGYVGNSGDATAPHLHFEIYAPGPLPTAPRIRNPYFSLKAAQVLNAPRAYPPRAKIVPQRGEIRWVGCVRRLEPDHSTMTLLLVSKQSPNGQSSAITHPLYRKFWLSSAELRALGGWETLRSVSPSAEISVYAPGDAIKMPIRALKVQIEH